MKIYAYTTKTVQALVKKAENKLKKNPKYNELMNTRLRYFQKDMLLDNKLTQKSK